MKDRLPALDGLRGFAAMSVVLGHASISSLVAGNIPVIPLFLIAFSAAHNAVQILFVLSGFLIAYLYPFVPDVLQFIRKRYARIIPVYGVIVVYLWTTTTVTNPWYLQLGILVLLACLISFGWKFINKFRVNGFGKIVFYSFVILQIGILIINLFFTQRFLNSGVITLPKPQLDFLTMLTNLTLTTQLIRGIHATSGVFWSLGVEILFYLLYPFIVVPIIRLAKKGGIIISILIILSVTKILLDLDNTVMSVGALNGMNIARANGFVAGVTIGTIYQSQGFVWNSIKKLVQHPFFGIVSILLLIIVQLAEHLVGLGSIEFMNIFYLITSWLIALIVLNAIIPNSITNRIFRGKIVTFLGLISYSLYLIHTEVFMWAAEIDKFFTPFISSPKTNHILLVIIGVGLSITVSYFLFRTVEFLYFASKKSTIATTAASYKEKVTVRENMYSPKHYGIIVVVSIIILSYLYSGGYSQRLLVYRHPFTNYHISKSQEISLMKSDIELPFAAQEDNLSVVGLDMRYEKSAGLTKVLTKNPALLRFELFDSQNRKIFQSERHAYEVEGSPRFQFGFPTINNSKGKGYRAKLVLINGKTDDNVIVKASSISFISISTTDKSTLIKNPLILVLNRIRFIGSDSNYMFLMLFILTLMFFPIAIRYTKKFI